MCGLAGAAGDTSTKVRDAFLDLLVVTQLRGRDSTGIFTVNNGDVSKYSKDLGTPDNLFDRKSFDDCLRTVPKVMAGHCRSKTIGDNTRENAHPYDFDSLIGMHNGTLQSYYGLDGYSHKRTDSYALFHEIDRKGPEEAIRGLDQGGAWALVWWNKVDNRLCFLRNGKRPLWFAWSKDKKTVFWASEPWMFGAVARHVDLWDGTEEGKDPVSPYFQLPEDRLWSFSVNAYPKPGEKYLTFHQPVEVKAEGKKSVGFTRTSSPTSFEGGEVSNPFVGPKSEEAYQRLLARTKEGEEARKKRLSLLKDTLNDDVSTIGLQGGQLTSPLPAKKSETTSSNVLDFRVGSKPSTSSQNKTLSLPSTTSTASRQNNKENGSGGCSGLKTKESKETKELGFPRVSLRQISGIWYITHNETSTEISLPEFEARTGGKCTHCKSPIGDLNEVAAFTDRALSAFLCTTCLIEPTLSVTG